jgi:hypothetical protein
MASRLDSSTPRGQRHGHEPGRSIPSLADRRRRGPSRFVSEPALADDDDVVRPDDVSIDEVVERLSRDISDAVNRAPFDGRDELRSYASEIVREDTAPPRVEARSPARGSRLSFFAVAVWLAVAGALLAIVIPLAGIACFIIAGIAMVLGVILGPADDGASRRVRIHVTPPNTPPPA